MHRPTSILHRHSQIAGTQVRLHVQMYVLAYAWICVRLHTFTCVFVDAYAYKLDRLCASVHGFC